MTYVSSLTVMYRWYWGHFVWHPALLYRHQSDSGVWASVWHSLPSVLCTTTASQWICLGGNWKLFWTLINTTQHHCNTTAILLQSTKFRLTYLLICVKLELTVHNDKLKDATVIQIIVRSLFHYVWFLSCFNVNVQYLCLNVIL